MTEENENLSFNFYLQVLVRVKTEMQIQLCKCCRTAHPFLLTFSSNFLSCDLWVFIFMFSFLINWKIPLVALFRSRHWELFRKTAVRQDITKTVNFFHKIGVSLQYSVLNKKVYKYIKSEILRRYSSRVMVKKSIWQLYRTTTFLAQLGMAASDHLLKGTLMQIWKSANLFYFLRYPHVRYVKSLFKNIQKFTNFTAKISRILRTENAKISEYCFYMNTNI